MHGVLRLNTPTSVHMTRLMFYSESIKNANHHKCSKEHTDARICWVLVYNLASLGDALWNKSARNALNANNASVWILNFGHSWEKWEKTDAIASTSKPGHRWLSCDCVCAIATVCGQPHACLKMHTKELYFAHAIDAAGIMMIAFLVWNHLNGILSDYYLSGGRANLTSILIKHDNSVWNEKTCEWIWTPTPPPHFSFCQYWQ